MTRDELVRECSSTIVRVVGGWAAANQAAADIVEHIGEACAEAIRAAGKGRHYTKDFMKRYKDGLGLAEVAVRALTQPTKEQP